MIFFYCLTGIPSSLGEFSQVFNAEHMEYRVLDAVLFIYIFSDS